MTDKELEKIVLGEMLINPKGIEEAILMLKSKYFSDKTYKLIYGAMERLENENKPIDSVAIYEFLKSKEHPVDAKVLAGLNTEIHSNANLGYHCAALIERWMGRQIVEQSKLIQEKAKRGTDIFDLISGSISEFESILEDAEVKNDERSFADRAEEVMQRIETARTADPNEQSEAVYKTKGYPSFNKFTDGIKKGNLVLISGKYKRAKTTFATQLMLDWAMQKIPVGIISLEMETDEVDNKIISLSTGTRYGYLRDPGARTQSGELILKDYIMKNMAKEVGQKLMSTKLFICDEVLNDTQVRAKIKHWVKSKGVQIVMVDYVGLIDTTKRFDRNDLEIAYLSRFLKLTAKSVKIPIVLIAQENEEGHIFGSKGPVRDADYWFSLTKPIEDGPKNLKINDVQVQVDQSHFVVKLKEARHSQSGGKFLCKFFENGEFKEIDPASDHYEEHGMVI